jgi:hypothetical protein
MDVHFTIPFPFLYLEGDSTHVTFQNKNTKHTQNIKYFSIKMGGKEHTNFELIIVPGTETMGLCRGTKKLQLYL